MNRASQKSGGIRIFLEGAGINGRAGKSPLWQERNIMIAEYLTRGEAEIYASELTQLYGPAVHFDVIGMPDPVFGDTWYVLGTGTIDGQMFAQYAIERKQCHNAADVMK